MRINSKNFLTKMEPGLALKRNYARNRRTEKSMWDYSKTFNRS